MKEIMVTRSNGQLVVSSREVAKNFEKGHRHVLEVIREIIEGMPKNRQTPPNVL